jgi:hypothetical protein
LLFSNAWSRRKFVQLVSYRHLIKFPQAKGTLARRNEAGRAAENVVGIVWVYRNIVLKSFPGAPTQ